MSPSRWFKTLDNPLTVVGRRDWPHARFQTPSERHHARRSGTGDGPNSGFRKPGMWPTHKVSGRPSSVERLRFTGPFFSAGRAFVQGQNQPPHQQPRGARWLQRLPADGGKALVPARAHREIPRAVDGSLDRGTRGGGRLAALAASSMLGGSPAGGASVLVTTTE